MTHNMTTVYSIGDPYPERPMGPCPYQAPWMQRIWGLDLSWVDEFYARLKKVEERIDKIEKKEEEVE